MQGRHHHYWWCRRLVAGTALISRTAHDNERRGRVRARNRLRRPGRSSTTALDAAAEQKLEAHHGSAAPVFKDGDMGRNRSKKVEADGSTTVVDRQPKPPPTMLPDSWRCSQKECQHWNFATKRDSKVQVLCCYRNACGAARVAGCLQWKNATAAQKLGPAKPKQQQQQQQQQPKSPSVSLVHGRQQPKQQQQQQQKQQPGKTGGGAAAGAPSDSEKAVAAARGLVAGHKSIHELSLRWNKPDVTARHLAEWEAAEAALDALLADEAKGPGIEDGSLTAAAVKDAQQYLALLLEHAPDDVDTIQAARVQLDEAKIANGSREADCLQSAEAGAQAAADSVRDIHARIATNKEQAAAIAEEATELGKELITAVDHQQACNRRVQDRIMSLSTKAPGILQIDDAIALSEHMQALNTLSQGMQAMSMREGGVPAEQLQGLFGTISALMRAAPAGVFTTSITDEAPSTVGAATLAGAPPPAAPAPGSVAELQARFTQREAQRARVEAAAAAAQAAAAAAAVERSADAALLQLARQAQTQQLAASRGSTTAVQYQVGITQAVPTTGTTPDDADMVDPAVVA